MKLFAIIGFLLISLISCSPPKDNNGVYKIYHEPKPIQSEELDKIIKEMCIVPLETRQECLIDYYISIQFTSDMILLMEGNSLQVLCFDLQGKFLHFSSYCSDQVVFQVKIFGDLLGCDVRIIFEIIDRSMFMQNFFKFETSGCWTHIRGFTNTNIRRGYPFLFFKIQPFTKQNILKILHI